MDLPNYFKDFVGRIRPPDSVQEELKKAHTELRERLSSDEDLSEIMVTTFLQGSYRRSTAIKPAGGEQADVDVVAVTNLDRTEITPEEALLKFKGFLNRHYAKKWKIQGRSIGIELEHVSLDLVVTAAPSEASQEAIRSLAASDAQSVNGEYSPENRNVLGGLKSGKAWEDEPLYIPDRDAGEWQATHPLRQISWTTEKNSRCSGHYISVVKALKWWRRELGYGSNDPKSYPLEHLIGLSCPDGISSVAEGIVGCLEDIASRYRSEVVSGEVPFLPDHGIPQNNVLARVSSDDFAEFHSQAVDAAAVARRAYDSDSVRSSCMAWREMFGDEFPECPDDSDGPDGDDKGGYTPRKKVTEVKHARYA